MLREATKTDLQRHDEEAERLIRPRPKVKPPRHDLRRERIETEADSDLDDASDKKDRSQNYKNIGGSVLQRLVHRARTELVPARNRETGKVVQVSPATLKERPGDYEVVSPEDTESSEEVPATETKDAPAEDTSKRTQFYQQAGDALRELAKSDPKLSNKLKDFARPDSQIFGFAKEHPEFPASKLFPGVTLPKGVNTLGDVREALANASSGVKKPKKKPESGANPKETTPKEGPAKTENSTPSKEKDVPKPEVPDQTPTKADLYQIKKPARREVFPEERQAAISLLVDTFPPEVSSELISKNLHPDDVRELVRNYSAAKVAGPKNLDRLVATVSKVYQPDPDSVEPPLKGRNAKGDTVSFDQLTPEEQAEATLSHQLQVSALSFAAKDMLTARLSQKGALSGKPRVPLALASSLAETVLRPPSDVPKASQKAFREALGTAEFVSPKTANSLLTQLSKYPGAKQLATAYFQAADYTKAKEDFLDKAEISEWDKPKAIVQGLGKAEKFFASRNKAYGTFGEHPSAKVFRQRVINRLNALDPVKAKVVRTRLAELEKSEYEDQKVAWQEAMKAFLKRKQDHAREQAEYLADPKGKTPPGAFEDELPKEPLKPAHSFDKDEGSALWRSLTEEPKPSHPQKSKDPQDLRPSESPKQLEDLASKAWDKAQQDQVKIATVLDRFTYLSRSVMASSAKTSVYHGIDPKENRSDVSEGWTQFRQRDFNESNTQALLTSAKDWLGSPLLTVAVNDMAPDARFRAALDLAIYTGPYNGAIPAPVYNDLLARLKGVSAAVKTATYKTANVFLAVYGPTPVDTKVLKTLEAHKFAFRDASGTLFEDGTLEAQVVRQGSVGAYPGYVGETLVRINFPEGSSEVALKGVTAALDALRLKSNEVTANYVPSSRAADESSFMPTAESFILTPDQRGNLFETLFLARVKDSQKLRKLASRAAKVDPKLALDLLAFADHLTEREISSVESSLSKNAQKEASSRYSSLRSLIIRQAFSVDASQREPWLPVLQALKDS